MIRVTVWNEYHESQRAISLYPGGLHEAIAGFLREESDFAVRTRTIWDEGQGLSEEVLEETDVLVYWAHALHGEVSDENAERVAAHVRRGMGAIFLHSAHMAKAFRRLMGTSCTLRWREVNERERLWVVDPTHPIAAGLPEQIVLPHEEMYGERFDIPAPDALVAIGWFQGGEVFRSACCYKRGYGRVVYLQPGHETNESFLLPDYQRLVKNAVRWTAGEHRPAPGCPCVPAEEKV